jgi:hypothetical protein
MTIVVEKQSAERIHFSIREKLSEGVTHIDALLDYAKEHDLEIEAVAEIVKKSSVLKEKVRGEARERKLLKDNEPIGTEKFIE